MRTSNVLTSNVSGFTVIELLVAMVILAVLMASAIPSFRAIQRSTELTAISNDLVFGLSTARAEAVKLGVATRLSAVSGNYQNGWQVATDANRSGTIDQDDILLIEGQVPKPNLAWTSATTNMVFDAVGRLVDPAAVVRFTIGEDAGYMRVVCVGLSGRVESFKGESNACS